MWGWHMDGDWSWWMLVGWLWMVIFWGIVAWAIVTLVQRGSGQRQPPGPSREEEDALTILERRYARGEIGTSEFEEKRRILKGG